MTPPSTTSGTSGTSNLPLSSIAPGTQLPSTVPPDYQASIDSSAQQDQKDAEGASTGSLQSARSSLGKKVDDLTKRLNVTKAGVRKSPAKPRSRNLGAKSGTSRQSVPSTTALGARRGSKDDGSKESSYGIDLDTLHYSTYGDMSLAQSATNIEPPTIKPVKGWNKAFKSLVLGGSYEPPSDEPRVRLFWRITPDIDQVTVSTAQKMDASPEKCPRFLLKVVPYLVRWNERGAPVFHILNSKTFTSCYPAGDSVKNEPSSVLNHRSANRINGVVPGTFAEWAKDFFIDDAQVEAAQRYVEEQAAPKYKEYVEQHRQYSVAYKAAEASIVEDAKRRREELAAKATAKKRQNESV